MFGRCIDQFYLWNYFVEWGKCAFMAKDKVSFGTIGRDLPTYLDCDNGPAPSLHHSWYVEATSALSEGLAEQDVGPSQVENSVALQGVSYVSEGESEK